MGNGQVALITGVGTKKNEGYLTAKKMLESGYQVIISGKKQDDLRMIASELNVDYIVINNTKKNSFENAIDRIKYKYGKLDVLINTKDTYR